MYLLTNTRLFQTKSDVSNKEFTLYNNIINSSIALNESSAELIRIIFDNRGRLKSKLFRLFSSVKLLLKHLASLGFLVEYPSENQKVFLLDDFSMLDNPLTSLGIELTNSCNYNCIHCYGSFGQPKYPSYISVDQIKKLIPELAQLHTIHVSLTGGECTLNDDFNSIAQVILENGLDLWILTNGSNFAKIQTLVENTSCHINIKVSLDGIGNIHNIIRNAKGSFEKVIRLIDYLYTKSNVTTYISTVLMKSNYSNYLELKHFIKDKYPNIIHRTDIIAPSGNALKNECFSINEFSKIYEDFPSLFNGQNTDTLKKNYRCTGGITQATICSDGRVKICNIACSKNFSFKYNAFEKGLIYCLQNRGGNIEKFHSEYRYHTKKCLNCSIKEYCTLKNCRVSSFLYLGDAEEPSPLSCFVAKMNEKVHAQQLSLEKR